MHAWIDLPAIAINVNPGYPYPEQKTSVLLLLFRLVLGLICVVILLTLCLSVCHKTITACITVNNGPRQDQVWKTKLQCKHVETIF